MDLLTKRGVLQASLGIHLVTSKNGPSAHALFCSMLPTPVHKGNVGWTLNANYDTFLSDPEDSTAVLIPLSRPRWFTI